MVCLLYYTKLSKNSQFRLNKGPAKEKPYYQRHLEETGELPGQQGKGFTTVGKPKMATKQYNSPIEMYGEEALDEIMEQGTLL